jgi:hypothetical protein
LDKDEFTLGEGYAHAGALARLHPQKRFVGDKIRPAAQSPPAPSPVRRAGLRAAGRQQLQHLRDMGFVEFVRRGEYRVSSNR